jgi:nitroimidazol reductase NimA-like FMN-containing flavoprotein (pyridoxamine 5'-phosphate oxidase superfamily)
MPLSRYNLDMEAITRTTMRRHAERSVPEDFAAIMEAGSAVHVAFTVGDQPHVIPVGYQYDAAEPGIVYLHGSRESRLLQHLATGAPISLCVTMIDGLVYSKQALTHSMNYRSAICFGSPREVLDLDVKRRVFEAMTLRYFPGRTAGVHYEPATTAQLDATLVVAVTIDELSAKARTGGPKGPTDADPAAFGTCGVAPPR